MAAQILPIATGADGRVTVGIRYDDVTMGVTAIGAINTTDRDATVTLLHVPSGISRTRTIAPGFSGVKSLTAGWTVTLDDDGVLQMVDVSISITFWAGRDG